MMKRELKIEQKLTTPSTMGLAGGGGAPPAGGGGAPPAGGVGAPPPAGGGGVVGSSPLALSPPSAVSGSSSVKQEDSGNLSGCGFYTILLFSFTVSL